MAGEREFLGRGWRFPVAVNLTGGIATSALEESVRESIFIIIGTAPGERVNRPDFGCGLRRMVFAPLDDATASLMQTTVFENLDRWLGNLITVDDVQARTEDSTLFVTVVYTLKSRGQQQILNLEVTV